MSGGLLDTSILIAADLDGGPLPPTAAISVISLGELQAGITLARDEATRIVREQRVRAVRASFVPLPVDEAIARRFGELLAFARSARRTEKATDLLILATAAETGRTLFTRDDRQAALAKAASCAVQRV